MTYLNDVEEGGETAFPVADNTTFDANVSCNFHVCFCFNFGRERNVKSLRQFYKVTTVHFHDKLSVNRRMMPYDNSFWCSKLID